MNHYAKEVNNELITINFFNDGCYIKGHDVIEICSVVSYSHYAVTNDMLLANDGKSSDVEHYASANDEKWSNLGFMFLKFNPDVKGRQILFTNFKENIWYWVNEMYVDRVKVINLPDKSIDWSDALLDAKQEQGIA